MEVEGEELQMGRVYWVLTDRRGGGVGGEGREVGAGGEGGKGVDEGRGKGGGAGEAREEGGECMSSKIIIRTSKWRRDRIILVG